MNRCSELINLPLEAITAVEEQPREYQNNLYVEITSKNGGHTQVSHRYTVSGGIYATNANFKSEKYCIFAHEVCVDLYNNEIRESGFKLGDGCLTKAQGQMCGLNIFTGKIWLHQLNLMEQARIIRSLRTERNHIIKRSFLPDEYINRVLLDNYSQGELERQKSPYKSHSSNRPFISSSQYKKLFDSDDFIRNGAWLECTDLKTITESLYVEKSGISPLNVHKIAVMLPRNLATYEPMGSRAYNVRKLSLKEIERRYNLSVQNEFKKFIQYHDKVIHPFILQTLIHSMKQQEVPTVGSFQYGASSDKYQAYLINFSVPKDLSISLMEGSIFDEDFPMIDIDHKFCTLSEHLNSLRGKTIVFDIGDCEYTNIDDHTTPSDQLPEGQRYFTHVRKDYGKRAQDVSYHILSAFKRYGVIDSFTIIEKKYNNCWRLHDCIIDMGDTKLKIVLGTDNGLPEQLACQKMVDACLYFSRQPCTCHVMNKALAKTCGFEAIDTLAVAEAVFDSLYGFMNTHSDQQWQDRLSDIGSIPNSIVKRLYKQLEGEQFFTNRCIARSPLVRLSSVVQLNKTHELFEDVPDNASIEEVDDETFSSIVYDTNENFKDEALLFMFAYVSYFESSCVDFLNQHQNYKFLDIQKFVNNIVGYEARGRSSQNREQPSFQETVPNYSNFTYHLTLTPLYDYAKQIQQQKQYLKTFAGIQTILSAELMQLGLKYHLLLCDFRDSSVLQHVRWGSVESICDILCGSLYVDIPLGALEQALDVEIHDDASTDSISTSIVLNISHFELTKNFFLRQV
ncbi:hypothetical protein PCE1_003783 [Barthelona sp. PCE]